MEQKVYIRKFERGNQGLNKVVGHILSDVYEVNLPTWISNGCCSSVYRSKPALVTQFDGELLRVDKDVHNDYSLSFPSDKILPQEIEKKKKELREKIQELQNQLNDLG